MTWRVWPDSADDALDDGSVDLVALLQCLGWFPMAGLKANLLHPSTAIGNTVALIEVCAWMIAPYRFKLCWHKHVLARQKLAENRMCERKPAKHVLLHMPRTNEGPVVLSWHWIKPKQIASDISMVEQDRTTSCRDFIMLLMVRTLSEIINNLIGNNQLQDILRIPYHVFWKIVIVIDGVVWRSHS